MAVRAFYRSKKRYFIVHFVDQRPVVVFSLVGLTDNPKMLNSIRKLFRCTVASKRDEFQALFAQAPFGVVMVDPQIGVMFSVNGHFAKLMGTSEAHLRDVPWATVACSVSPSGETDAHGFTHPISAADARVHRLLRADDVQVFVEVSALATFPDRQGHAVCVLMVKDISEQVLAEEQLRVSEQRLRLLTDSARDVVWTMSPLGQATYVSPAVLQLRGITPSEAMAQTIDETLTPDSRDAVMRYFFEVATAVQQGVTPPQFRSELEYWRRDGSKFWTEVLAFPVMGANGALVEILGVTRDISQRRLYEDSLLEAREMAEKSNAAKTEFLAHISHEIRTPMTAILSLTELVLNTPLSESQQSLLNKSKSAGRLLLGIINDILDLSKLDNGKLELANAPFDVNDVLQQVSDLVSETCAIKGLRYDVEMAQDVCPYRIGDSQRLAQALLNLVGNAVKFTEQGHVRVWVRRLSDPGQAEQLRFEVQDTGIGLAPALRAKVFEGFVQGDNAQTRAHGGTGLGLSICKRLAQQMGGDVGVTSQEGQGSTFWFTVQMPVGPSVPSAHLKSASAQTKEMPRQVQGVHILLVEDNLSMQGVLKQLLELAGARVDLAENGQVAIQMIDDVRYDLVLMDMQMPILGGLDATQIIRQKPAHQDLPIVALTARGFIEDRDRCAEAGMNDYLMKPFEYKDLIAVLQRNIPSWSVEA